jgi:uncharacterized membrane protein YjjP (DUF1212 family)
VNTSRVAELVSIAVALGGCLLWVGATANEVESAKTRIEKVEQTPTDVAVLKTQMTVVQESVKEVKEAQRAQDQKLDAILQELRRR